MLGNLPHIQVKPATKKKYSLQHLQAGKVKLLLRKKARAFPDDFNVNDPRVKNKKSSVC